VTGAPKGPFTAHVVMRGKEHTMARQTLRAAENFLLDYFDPSKIEARWITNAQGNVHTRFAFDKRVTTKEQS